VVVVACWPSCEFLKEMVSHSHDFKYPSSFQKFLSIARLPNMGEPGEQKCAGDRKLNNLIVHSFLKHVQICVRTNGRLA
jgi:hypothetical protein